MPTPDLVSTSAWLLGRPLTVADSLSESEILAAESRLGVRVPKPLRDLILALGNEPSLMSSFQRFLRPDEWRLFGDKLHFLDECQCVCIWAVDAGQHVYQSNDEKREIWYQEDEDLPHFLLTILYYQMAQQGYEFAGNIGTDAFSDLASVEAFIDRHGGRKVVDSAGLRIHVAGEQALVWYLHDGERLDDGGLFLAALHEATYEHIAEAWGFDDLD